MPRISNEGQAGKKGLVRDFGKAYMSAVVALILLLCQETSTLQEERKREIEKAVEGIHGRGGLAVATQGNDEREDRAFFGYATRISRMLKSYRFQSAPLAVASVSEFLYTLQVLKDKGKKLDVLVLFGHGGWDGPLFGRSFRGDPIGQISPAFNTAQYEEMIHLLKSVMNPGGLIVVHACHSAGSNRDEQARNYPTGNWVRSLAERVGVFTAGVKGPTAMDLVRDGRVTPLLQMAVQAALNGGTLPQERDFVGPWGLPVPKGFRWLRDREGFIKRLERAGN